MVVVKPSAPRALTDEQAEFVEAFALELERDGLARIGGRIFGLSMVVESPLSLDDIARLLKASRASASTNVRLFLSAGLLKRVSIPGDRRDYYTFEAGMWEQRLARSGAQLDGLRAVAEKGRTATAPGSDAAERIEEMVDFCEFYQAELQSMLGRWRVFRANKSASKGAPSAPAAAAPRARAKGPVKKKK